jgi:selenocysteine lyase/cysteine desulfurase
MDWFERFRSEFPILKQVIYAEVALINPLATRVMEAVSGFLKRVQQGEYEKRTWDQDLVRLRQNLSGLIGAKANEIAFTKNTAEGINILAQSMPWKPGDKVLVTDQEHPNNLLPWLNLRPRGVEIRVVRAVDFRLPVDLIWSGVEDRTRVIAISHVQYNSGFRADLIELGKRCRKAGIKLVVDGIQGIGTLQVDVSTLGIDALACGGHKALLAPPGVGFLYCREDLLETLSPAYSGTSPVTKLKREGTLSMEVEDARDARRLEMGTLNYPGLFGLTAGLDLLREAGIERIEPRVLSLSGHFIEGLRNLDYHVLSSPRCHEWSGIVGVLAPDPQDFRDFLRRSGIRATLMDSGILRFSFHAYNLDQEIDRILESARIYEKKN